MNIVKSLLCAGVFAAFTTSAIATEEKDGTDVKKFALELKKHLKNIPPTPIENLDNESETYKFFNNNFKKFTNDKIKLKTLKREDFNWQDIKVDVEGKSGKSVKLIKIMEDTEQTGQLTFYKGLRQALSKYIETDLTKNDLIRFYLKAIKKNYLEEVKDEKKLKSIPEHKTEITITEIQEALVNQFDRFYTFLDELNNA
ncbi:MAG: hypothetical protein HYS39_01525, partial [Proteobacteria bacterium]|nr:hypothetical protein [Pseudomonadota bacterium]